MTTVFPRRNLGPDAEPWGRTIQGAVSGLERNLEQAVNSNNATDQMQTTQLNSLVQSQKVLQDQQTQLNAAVGRLDQADAARKWQTHENNFFEFDIPPGTPYALQLIETVTVEVPPNTASMVSISGQITVDITNSTSPFSDTGNTAELRVYVNSIPPQLEHVRASGLYLAGPPGGNASSGLWYQGTTNNMYNRVYVPQMETTYQPETFTFRIYCALGNPVATGNISVGGRYKILVESSPWTSAGTF